MTNKYDFVRNMWYNSPDYHEQMTLEQAKEDLRNFSDAEMLIPTDLTPESYMEIWNGLVAEQIEQTEVETDDGDYVRFNAAVALMDDEIRETVHAEGITDPQKFFDRYCELHREKLGEYFTVV